MQALPTAPCLIWQCCRSEEKTPSPTYNILMCTFLYNSLFVCHEAYTLQAIFYLYVFSHFGLKLHYRLVSFPSRPAHPRFLAMLGNRNSISSKFQPILKSPQLYKMSFVIKISFFGGHWHVSPSDLTLWGSRT